MNLRKAARGRQCMIRLPGCTGGGRDTVLCHYRLAGQSGIGQKPPDIMGAWGCVECHSRVDGRVKTEHDRKIVRLAHAEGVLRTLAVLWREDFFGEEKK